MIVVSHEAALVREIANHAICLRDGKVVAEGSPSEVL